MTAEFLIPFANGDVVSYLNDHANVLETEYVEDGTKVKVELERTDYDRLNQYLI